MTEAPHETAGPPPFTAEDFEARMERAGKSAQEAGLSGVLVTPGPDLLYLTGYAPLAITERITMLVLAADREPALIVPMLERPDAESAPGSSNARNLGLVGRHRSVRGRRAAPRPQGPLRDLGRGLGACTCSVSRAACPTPATCR